MNVLITSASAKVSLIKAFKRETEKRGGKVIAIDLDPFCCAKEFADVFEIAPEDNDPEYASRILEICKRHQIGLLIPTRDGELLALADMTEELFSAGVRLAGSTRQTLEQCQDKISFFEFCNQNGFPVLPRHLEGEAEFPLFARHRKGRGSFTNLKIRSLDELERLLPDPSDYLIQPFTDIQEYSCDTLMDFEGNPVQSFLRERQRINNGESWRTQSVDVPEVTNVVEKLAKTLGLRGHNLIQLFYDRDVGLFFTEVNPRFGGGSNLSIEGGLCSPERLMLMAEGKTAQAQKKYPIEIGLTLLRYGEDIFVKQRG